MIVRLFWDLLICGHVSQASLTVVPGPQWYLAFTENSALSIKNPFKSELSQEWGRKEAILFVPFRHKHGIRLEYDTREEYLKQESSSSIVLQTDLYDCSFILINDSLSKLPICQLTSKQKTQINSEEVLSWIESNMVTQPKDEMFLLLAFQTFDRNGKRESLQELRSWCHWYNWFCDLTNLISPRSMPYFNSNLKLIERLNASDIDTYLNNFVLSNQMPAMMDPPTPATTRVSPIIPASSSRFWPKAKKD